MNEKSNTYNIATTKKPTKYVLSTNLDPGMTHSTYKKENNTTGPPDV